jgi:hypothetical protein
MQMRQELNAGFNPPFSNRNLSQNVDGRPLMTVGTWHHWEFVMQLNTLGQNNGIYKMWIDGIKVMDYQDVTYIWSGATHEYWQYKWNPTWGGTAGVRTRDDFMYLDHLYISGVP